MERHTSKSAVLVAFAILGSACAPGGIGSGCAPGREAGDRGLGEAANNKSEQLPQNEQSTHPQSDSEPSPAQVVGDNADAKQREVECSAEDVVVAPPKLRAHPDRPWAHNTGPNAPDALKPSGSLTISTNGAVLEDLDITGDITIDANNVTIRNFRINATAFYGITVVEGHNGVLLEDGEIHGMSSAAILGVGFTARRLHIHDGAGDGIKAQGTGGPTIVESCFIEKLGTGADAHADGNQTRGGSNITFRYNNIYLPSPGTPNYPGAPYKSNAAFMLELEISNFVIERNWLNGGNYTIYSPGGVSVRDNFFGRDNGGLSEGNEALRIRTGTFEQWSGNVWEDSGDPI